MKPELSESYMRWADVTFSILKRIVMGETEALGVDSVSDYGFQYPQADRDG